MPSYYLSYVEIKRHAAMMLSSQEDASEPVKIELEVGFGHRGSMQYLNRTQGIISHESNASRAGYSKSAVVNHRTWQISKAEMERFKNIVERDKSEAKPQEQKEGTPEYQFLIMNCKSYAMSVLKEVGIQEALEVENLLVQIPGSTKDKLKRFKKTDFHYPLKESFINNFSEEIVKIRKSLNFIMENSDEIEVKANIINNSIAKNNFLNLVKDTEIIAKRLDRIKTKAGFDIGYFFNFFQLQKHLDRLSTYQTNVSIPQPEGTEQAKLTDILAYFKGMENPILREEMLRSWKDIKAEPPAREHKARNDNTPK